MALPDNDNEGRHEGPVIRDKRRIDPETGELRTPAEAAAAPAPEEPEAAPAAGEPGSGAGTADAAELAEARERVGELTNDLKRVQAEYANYRKRVDRDRLVVREQALSQVLGELLPILDDVGRAREHGELSGGFKSVGESLESLATKLGLKKYAEKGDEFDPNVHEALTLVESPDVTVPTVIEVFQPGYLIGERVLRPARVVVAEGSGDTAETGGGAPAEPEPGDDAGNGDDT
ncbi:nucleotide exchange factor GrpE [Nocardiopsis sediminis]|uniref:Protein GrpE n=1 Tax=Nocardiopsis sediminis TaxID=1778267 RepID=A0ABV8FTU3_9ACTN